MKRLLLVLLTLMIIVLPCLASASEAISSNSNELSDLEKLQLQLQKVKQIYAGDTNSAEIHRALDQVVLPVISEPRAEVSRYAPKMITMHIDPDRIREVIGKGGSVIQKIVAESGAKIDIDDDGTIHIASPDAESCAIAKKCIDDIVFVPEVGQLYYGRVVRLMTFGAFVELAPGKDGLVHISKLADKRIEKVEDACKIGDMMWVKVTEIDEKGRVNLSHKDAMKEIAAKEAAGEPIK